MQTGPALRLATTTVRVLFVSRVYAPTFGMFADSDDIKDVDLTKIHYLTGPVAVEGAEPGDCLVVDILDGTPSSCVPVSSLTPHAPRISYPVREDALGLHREWGCRSDRVPWCLTQNLDLGYFRAGERRRSFRYVIRVLPSYPRKPKADCFLLGRAR